MQTLTHPNLYLLTLYLIAAAFSIISTLAVPHWLMPALCRPKLHTTSRNDLNISLVSYWMALNTVPRVSIVAHKRAFLMVYRVPLNFFIFILFLSFFTRTKDPTLALPVNRDNEVAHVWRTLLYLEQHCVTF